MRCAAEFQHYPETRKWRFADVAPDDRLALRHNVRNVTATATAAETIDH